MGDFARAHQGGSTRVRMHQDEKLRRQPMPVKNMVLAQNRPAASTPAPNPKATRVPAAGATPKKLTDTEFIKQYGDRFEAGGLAEWMNYLTTGAVPAVRRR